MADLVTGRPFITSTLFLAQSITKTMTALATLKLLAREGIALDEPVNRYLKEWTIPDNKFTEIVPVTFRMLLNHTAGFSNTYPDGCCGPKEPLPPFCRSERAASGNESTPHGLACHKHALWILERLLPSAAPRTGIHQPTIL
jgi:CubicO group peptidase (beta-lactamase class C family)